MQSHSPCFHRVDALFDCQVCGKDSITYVSKFPGNGPSALWKNALVRWCEKCGSGCLIEGDQIISDYYSDRYAADRRDRTIPIDRYFSEDGAKTSPFLKNLNERVARHIKVLEDHGATFNEVLDFGCGPGLFLFKSKPERAFAIEPDENSRKYLDHFGATVISLDDIGTNRFDIVASSHSMEHLPPSQLEAVLSKLAASLKVGGLMMVEVPGTAYSYHEGPEENEPHSIFFSNAGLKRAVQRSGLQIVYAQAQASHLWRKNDNPIWEPPAEDTFEASRLRCPLVVARKLSQ